MKQTFIKTYLKSAILDTQISVEKRIALINNFDYKKYPALVKTTIEFYDNIYTYRQEKLKIIKKENFEKKDFYEIVKALEYFESIGYVHGDLNKKNIIYTAQGFKIVDYEPSLMQIKNNIPQLMVTLPYVLKEELTSKKISIETDKLGFIYFLLRINKLFSSLEVVKLTKTLQHENNNLSLLKLTYTQILDKISRHKDVL